MNECNKRYKNFNNWNEEKVFIICGWYSLKIAGESMNKLLELIRESIKLDRYKSNILKSTLLLCNNNLLKRNRKISSVQFSHSVVSDSLLPHEPQHTRPPCPSQTPGLYPNSCPLSRWCHLTLSSSVIPFLSCLQSFPTSGSFPMSQLFAWGGQNIGVSASASVLPMKTQDWFPSG